jgi:hypothetical protein
VTLKISQGVGKIRLLDARDGDPHSPIPLNAVIPGLVVQFGDMADTCSGT